MGTPEFAVPCLERLLHDGHGVAAVFTQPDKPKGRKMLLTPPPVKECARAAGIPVEQPAALRGGEALAKLRGYAPELIVVVAYGKLLPPEVLALPEHGCINVHASLLPKYRGAAPIQWALLNGESESGVTTMQMDAGLDTGDMLLQRRCGIPEDADAGELHKTLSVLGADALAETLRLLTAGALVPQSQGNAQTTYAPMLSKALSPLDWNRPAAALHNQVRGLHPWPGAEAVLGGRRLKLRKSRAASEANADRAPGTVWVEGGRVLVSCGSGTLELLELQPEGKRAMPAAEFMRGLHREGALRFDCPPK
ncbi:MAG: methionyl-tRNA formyltransferase [Oscillospiraceae bacterium]|jgi:methionyl-tRNA formyltransferase|nr:methionyl-tRNA formyltransferase [Oscillospiraceae bacterium]